MKLEKKITENRRGKKIDPLNLLTDEYNKLERNTHSYRYKVLNSFKCTITNQI